jgi:hypothetical protein
MAIRLRHTDPHEKGEFLKPQGKAWLGQLSQLTSLVYLVGGILLLYQYATRLRRPMALVVGVLFVLYGVYRFFLVRRSTRIR